LEVGVESTPVTLTIPPIGLGTGGPDRLNDVGLMTGALEMGYRHIDTAQSYETEAEVGEAVATAAVSRDDILVATKIEKHNLGYDDAIEAGRQCRDSLGVDTIDLLYVHFPTTTYDPEATLGAMDDLVDEGVAEHIGLSNFSPDELEEAAGILDHPIAAHQVEMHPFWQQRELVSYCQDAGIPVVAYTPIARGMVFDSPEITAVADKHDTDAVTVTLAWLTSIDGVSAIPMTTSEAHLRANLVAPELELDGEDVERIESIEETKKFVDID
jgi:2,5-diketo-D-gluconate reductase B